MNFPRHKKHMVLVLSLFFMSLLFLFGNIYRLASLPMVIKEADAPVVSLDKSASATQFAKILQDKHLICCHKFFSLLIRAKGLSQQLKAGIYKIKAGESALQLLDRVVAGDVMTQTFTIIAGTTQQRISQDLVKAAYLDYHPDDWSVVQGHYANAEGLLLADTYQYPAGESSKSLLIHARHHLMNYLNAVWAKRAPDLPYKNPYELLIAASIIEKETALPHERRLIAGVVVNRLNKRMPLQMDPTVIYGLGTAYTGKLSHQDMQVDSPYNSYRNRGLPPTPIAMVSKEALDAASQPQWSNFLYFVAKGDGSHRFSETYQQQRHAIDQYKHKEL